MITSYFSFYGLFVGIQKALSLVLCAFAILCSSLKIISAMTDLLMQKWPLYCDSQSDFYPAYLSDIPNCFASGDQSLIHVRLFPTPWTAACRLLCPWDFPCKNTGVGCHLLLQPYNWYFSPNTQLKFDSAFSHWKLKYSLLPLNFYS